MTRAPHNKKAVLMIAYTNYRSDPRVIREAEAALCGGFNVDFIALRRAGEPDEETIQGVRVIHLDQYRYRGGGWLRYMLSYFEFFVRCFFKTTFLYLNRRYAVVHVNNMPDFFVFCTLVPKLMGAKVLLDIHDPMPDTFASKFKRGEKSFVYKLLLWQERLSAWYADRILTVNDPLKEHVLARHGLPLDSIHIIANFADEQLFQLREDYRVDGKLRLVFHGTILERYGLHDLMIALSKVRHRDKIHVKFIGEGDFAARLHEMIASLNLGDTVEFVNRVYPLQEIPRVLADSNLGLVPVETTSITNYALPLKLLEYISLGIPVITVRSAAIGYYFDDDDCLFYRPEDPGSLPALIDRLAEDPNILLHYRERAVALREKFLWGNEKKKYIALLRELSNVPQEEPALVSVP
jgi:glycosyltransferase involved in cell wall biosynthesis